MQSEVGISGTVTGSAVGPGVYLRQIRPSFK